MLPTLKHHDDTRAKDMHPNALKIEMMRAGISQMEIATALRVTPSAVHLVVSGKAVSHRIRKAIADSIGMDIKKIWPSTYLYGGGPRRSGRPATR